MCPFNTQNTIFHTEAFWGLLIPITTSFRVCDIWRGYCTQRLLWEIKANLCFLPSHVVQERNEHNLLHDFIDEIDLYTKVNALVDFLKKWRSTHATLFERMICLVDAMIERGFYKENDGKLVRAWVQDLQNLGYDPPMPA
jgi:hypothetical protein